MLNKLAQLQQRDADLAAAQQVQQLLTQQLAQAQQQQAPQAPQAPQHQQQQQQQQAGQHGQAQAPPNVDMTKFKALDVRRVMEPFKKREDDPVVWMSIFMKKVRNGNLNIEECKVLFERHAEGVEV
uniref:Uncharacterized protein n=1 Tax=Chromera velia CCMP2878 TaxID=1169474 RepID=A0A0G4I5G9_9ALVE|eukprot:Cvel_11104.t1-p1 / transcript=Cvel_11104.t1 / gene=Cvel_11104 / organism=Chromera_velia_CCMP2878 / gene_product=hypothetical protein / transcript_product=hypothetical protein / location=Cvel_scaffold687:26917-27477(-) / protein_length=125 / sequence_SO=supercontig / SO=protein_coding / is_pseudo=false